MKRSEQLVAEARKLFAYNRPILLMLAARCRAIENTDPDHFDWEGATG